MKTLNLTTAKIGEKITLETSNEYRYRYNDSAHTEWAKFHVGSQPTVVGFVTVNEHDDHGAIVENEFFEADPNRPEVWYLVNVFDPASGEIVGQVNVNPLDCKQRKKVEWLCSIEEHIHALRRAVKRGQTTLIVGLTRGLRKKSIKEKLNKRRNREFKRGIVVLDVKKENAV